MVPALVSTAVTAPPASSKDVTSTSSSIRTPAARAIPASAFSVAAGSAQPLLASCTSAVEPVACQSGKSLHMWWCTSAAPRTSVDS